RQILVLGGQTVGDQGTEAGPARQLMTGMAQINGRGVVELLGIAAAKNDEIIRYVTEIRVEIGDRKTTLASRAKLPWAAAENGFRGIVDEARFDDFRQLGGQGFAGVFGQLRLRVERI